MSLEYCPRPRAARGGSSPDDSNVGPHYKEALVMGDKRGYLTLHYPCLKTLWKVETRVFTGPWVGASATRLKVHDGWVLRLKYIDSLRLLATTSADCTVKLVDIVNMEVKYVRARWSGARVHPHSCCQQGNLCRAQLLCSICGVQPRNQKYGELWRRTSYSAVEPVSVVLPSWQIAANALHAGTLAKKRAGLKDTMPPCLMSPPMTRTSNWCQWPLTL